MVFQSAKMPPPEIPITKKHMPHRGLIESSSSSGPEPIELRADSAFGFLTPLDEGGNSWSDLDMVSGGGTLTEADSDLDAPETNEDLEALSSRVHEYATSISDALEELKATDNASIREAVARKITNTLGFLDAWMDHFYTHPAYKATETLRQEGLGNLLGPQKPESVAEGIDQMRQFIGAVLAIDFAKAVEVPYDKLYSPESNAAFQERKTAYEDGKAKSQRELHATPEEDLG